MVANIVKADFVQAEQSGTLQIRSMDDLSRMSKMMADSGFFSDCKSAAQAGVKIMCGLELGFPAFSSLVGIHIIQGKPVLGANLMAAAVKRSGKYNYRVLEHTNEVCRIAFFEAGEQVGISEFTAADAKSMSVKNMERMAKNMLLARAISNGVRWYAPDIVLGAPVYTPEELGATTNDDGTLTIDSVQVQVQEQLAPAVASAAQRKQFRALGLANGWTDDEMRQLLLDNHIASSKEIPIDSYQALCDALKSGKPSGGSNTSNATAIESELESLLDVSVDARDF